MPESQSKEPQGDPDGIQDESPAKGPALAIDNGHLTELVGFHIRRAYSKLFQSFNEAMSDLGIAPGQYSVLLLMSLNPGLRQSTLADAAGLDRSTIVPVITGFVKKGWVRRTRRRDDRRAYSLRLTPAGEEAIRRSQPIIEKHEALLAGDLSDDERKTLIALLDRIRGDGVD